MCNPQLSATLRKFIATLAETESSFIPPVAGIMKGISGNGVLRDDPVPPAASRWETNLCRIIATVSTLKKVLVILQLPLPPSAIDT
mmetsp:Transcript_41941/g.68035  ORF Transcript_41941/g.68035 Transcript_41941/m.68035 type:complete len:86 (+) Transcript_41941:1663-1920(+)